MLKSKLIIIALLATCACSNKRAAQHSASSSLTIDAIHKNLEAYRDQAVTLDGFFLGWRGGECRMPAHASDAITRSDWIFKNGDDCLYVTGGRPSGFSPSELQHIGRRLQLEAVVRLTKEQKAYLEFVSGKTPK